VNRIRPGHAKVKGECNSPLPWNLKTKTQTIAKIHKHLHIIHLLFSPSFTFLEYFHE
jgi:hypothetical protein